MSESQKAIDAVVGALDRATGELDVSIYIEVLEELIADFDARAEAAHGELESGETK